MTDELTDTLREIVARLDAMGIDYMLVGSVAALAYGRSRSTQDLDVVVAPDEGPLRALLRSLPSERFYASESALREAVSRQTQFNIIDMDTGWKVDVIPRKRRPFSETEFSRRSRLDVLGVEIYVATVEDTIVAKLEWAKAGGGSERQLEDVRELVRLAAQNLDRDYVLHWVGALDLRDMWNEVDAD